MGAMEAFSRTFSLLLKNKRLYMLVLIMTLLLAPLEAYLVPADVEDFSVFNQSYLEGNTSGIIVEEHGATVEDETAALMELLKKLALYGLIVLVVSSIFEYAVTKGLFIEPEESGPLGGLLLDGVKHFPGVIIVNLVYTLLTLAFVGVSTLPIVIGIITLPVGAVLILVGLLLLIFVGAFAVGLSSLAIPAYVKNESIGGAFEGFGLAFRNVLSTAGFGFLLMLGIFAISLAISPIAFIVHYTVPGEIAPYISALLQAPLEALMYMFMWTGGVAFYTELKKKEELEKVDEELAELGIEL
ncbi:MAG: hypothetical protein J7L37_08245 [Thermococcus sp.]|nr:hypothetical protein [Thermococcus sp.]